MAGFNKSNFAEHEKRVAIVLDALSAGLKRREIIEAVHEWGVTDAQIDKYIADAKEEVIKLGEKNIEKAYIKAKSRYEFLYRKLVNVRDYKSAIVVVDKEVELDGLKIQKIENSITMPTIIEL